MVNNISCKFEKASYNIFLVRAVMVKSLYTLRGQRRGQRRGRRRRRRRGNEVKSIVSTGCYPVDTMKEKHDALMQYFNLPYYSLLYTSNMIHYLWLKSILF